MVQVNYIQFGVYSVDVLYKALACYVIGAVVRPMYVYGDLLKIGSLLREDIPFSN